MQTFPCQPLPPFFPSAIDNRPVRRFGSAFFLLCSLLLPRTSRARGSSRADSIKGNGDSPLLFFFLSINHMRQFPDATISFTLFRSIKEEQS